MIVAVSPSRPNLSFGSSLLRARSGRFLVSCRRRTSQEDVSPQSAKQGTPKQPGWVQRWLGLGQLDRIEATLQTMAKGQTELAKGQTETNDRLGKLEKAQTQLRVSLGGYRESQAATGLAAVRGLDFVQPGSLRCSGSLLGHLSKHLSLTERSTWVLQMAPRLVEHLLKARPPLSMTTTQCASAQDCSSGSPGCRRQSFQ